MVSTTAIAVSAVVAVLIAAAIAAYLSGAADPLIEELAKYFFKAKAEAEAKALEAKGLKEGQDFAKGELSGSKQAAGVEADLGNFKGGLKI